MLRLFFLLFITVPLLELYVLIRVGSDIGGLATIALCLLTAALGGLLIRLQGLGTLFDAQRRMAHGEFPAEHGLHGLMLGLAGILLFTPGFITDAAGFLLLVPPLRRWIIARLMPIRRHTHNATVIEAEIVHEERHRP